MDGRLEIPDLPGALKSLLVQIPAGRVSTYGDLATALGDVRAARWVGTYLLDHPHQDECVCHRVVRSDGSLGLYVSGDVGEKAARLRGEGIDVRDDRVRLPEIRFAGFTSDAPLQHLADQQRSLLAHQRIAPLSELPERFAGVDVSYAGPGRAVGAYTVTAADSGELLWSTLVDEPVRFPYVSGYLAYRELPVLLALLEKAEAAGQSCDVTFVDGNGILHHRGIGIATQLGILAGTRTIGIGKTLQCGTVELVGLSPDAGRPVVHRGEVVGMAVKSQPHSRPVFVSPGDGIDLTSATRCALTAFRGHRVPEPIYWADRLSRAAAREQAS